MAHRQLNQPAKRWLALALSLLGCDAATDAANDDANDAGTHASADATPLEPSTIPLWNGDDLSAFDFDPALWRVEDGTIVAHAASGTVTENRFLIYRAREVSDFELRGEVWVGAGGNSGVQYRSRVINAERHRVAGYQADMAADYFGMLYDEAGERGILRETTSACASAAAEQWHSFQIRAVGNELVHWIDGHECTRFRDDHETRALHGVLALQYHTPGGYEIRYRKLELTTL